MKSSKELSKVVDGIPEVGFPTKQKIEWIIRKYSIAEKLLRWFKKKEIVDIGCGYGIGTKFLHDQGYSVVGVDYWKPLVEYCRSKYPKIPFIHARAEEFDISKFDGIVAIDVVEHFKDPKGVLKKWYSEMKSDSILIVRTPHREIKEGRSRDYNPHHHYELTPEEVVECLPGVVLYKPDVPQTPHVFWFYLYKGLR